MDEKRKAISADDRLRALALYTIAKEHAIKVREFEVLLNKILLVEDGGHFADRIWGADKPPTVAEFDEALDWSGIAVLPQED